MYKKPEHLFKPVPGYYEMVDKNHIDVYDIEGAAPSNYPGYGGKRYIN